MFSKDINVYVTETLRAQMSWLGRSLADEKMEMVLMTNSRKTSTVKGETGGHRVVLGPAIK